MSSTSGSPLPAATPTREELARIEVGHTAVSPALARVLTLAFVLAIAVVPVVEWAGGQQADELARGAWGHLTRLPAGVHKGLAGAPPDTSAWRRVVAANRQVLAGLRAFEDAIDDESILGRTLRRPAQAVMSGALGAGNERVYPGKDGWLFYRPDVDYVTGEGFLAPAWLRRRTAAAAEWDRLPHPDPRPAIVDFGRSLEDAGVTLIVMPTPVKPGVHPEALSSAYVASDDVLHNASYGTFVADLRLAGVLVFDPSEMLARSARTEPQYLASDTHWRPEAMEAVADLLGAFISAHVALPAAPDPGFRVERTEVRNVGDTARMLDLPEGSTLFPAEAVWLRRVLMPDGAGWRSSRGSDVLLLGDSFSNIYSLESMGWGTSAGFAEQLSLALGRPIDRIVQNDEGAFATRAMLQRDAGRLDGVRVVVYQFAARELASGDWRVLPMDR